MIKLMMICLMVSLSGCTVGERSGIVFSVGLSGTNRPFFIDPMLEHLHDKHGIEYGIYHGKDGSRAGSKK